MLTSIAWAGLGPPPGGVSTVGYEVDSIAPLAPWDFRHIPRVTQLVVHDSALRVVADVEVLDDSRWRDYGVEYRVPLGSTANIVGRVHDLDAGRDGSDDPDVRMASLLVASNGDHLAVTEEERPGHCRWLSRDESGNVLSSVDTIAEPTCRNAALMTDGGFIVATTEPTRVERRDASGAVVWTAALSTQIPSSSAAVNVALAQGRDEVLATWHVLNGSVDDLRAVRLSLSGDVLSVYDLPDFAHTFAVASSDGGFAIAGTRGGVSAQGAIVRIAAGAMSADVPRSFGPSTRVRGLCAMPGAEVTVWADVSLGTTDAPMRLSRATHDGAAFVTRDPQLRHSYGGVAACAATGIRLAGRGADDAPRVQSHDAQGNLLWSTPVASDGIHTRQGVDALVALPDGGVVVAVLYVFDETRGTLERPVTRLESYSPAGVAQWRSSPLTFASALDVRAAVATEEGDGYFVGGALGDHTATIARHHDDGSEAWRQRACVSCAQPDDAAESVVVRVVADSSGLTTLSFGTAEPMYVVERWNTAGQMQWSRELSITLGVIDIDTATFDEVSLAPLAAGGWLATFATDDDTIRTWKIAPNGDASVLATISSSAGPAGTNSVQLLASSANTFGESRAGVRFLQDNSYRGDAVFAFDPVGASRWIHSLGADYLLGPLVMTTNGGTYVGRTTAITYVAVDGATTNVVASTVVPGRWAYPVSTDSPGGDVFVRYIDANEGVDDMRRVSSTGVVRWRNASSVEEASVVGDDVLARIDHGVVARLRLADGIERARVRAELGADAPDTWGVQAMLGKADRDIVVIRFDQPDARAGSFAITLVPSFFADGFE